MTPYEIQQAPVRKLIRTHCLSFTEAATEPGAEGNGCGDDE